MQTLPWPLEAVTHAKKQHGAGLGESMDAMMHWTRSTPTPPLLPVQDIMLFEALLSDLFPGCDAHPPEQQALLDALHVACRDCGLQPEPGFVRKAVQLHDTLGVRFGVMVVGPAGRQGVCTLKAGQK